MPRITKIYTRGGDDGSTSLAGGQRVPKNACRIEAYGTVDELNSQIGVALAAGLEAGIATALGVIQNELFHLGADLSTLEEDKKKRPGPRIEPRHVDSLEALLDEWTPRLGPLENFILPAGSAGAAALHVARTVCRRAERLVVTLAEQEPAAPEALRYMNRLSDLLFVMARRQNDHDCVPDTLWDSRA